MTKTARYISAIGALALLCAVQTASPRAGFAANGPAKLRGVAVLGGGAPMDGGAVAVIDGGGKTATTTVNARGRFTLDVQGLTPPFLLQATPSGGDAPMYGFAASAGVANVDAYTDLILNLVYAALSTTPQVQFGQSAPLPAGQSTASLSDNLRLASSITQNLLTSWFLADKIKPGQFTFFENKFSDNRKKFGLLVHQTSVTTPFASGSEVLEISDGKTTQDITFTSAAPSGQVTTGTVTGSSATSLPGGGKVDTTASTAIMVNAEQAAELDAINALLQAFQTDVNTGGKKLAASDIQGLFNPLYLRGGENLTNATADLVTGLRGQKLAAIGVSGINSIVADPADSGMNDFNVLYEYASGKQTVAPVTEVFQCPSPIGSGACTFWGNQQLAQVQDAVQLSTFTESSLTNSDATSTALGVDVLSPIGSLSSITVDDTNHIYFHNTTVPLANTVAQDFVPTVGLPPLVYNQDENRWVLTPLSSNPAPGLDFSITVTTVGGAVQDPYVTTMTGSPGEAVNLVEPPLTGDHALTAAPIGQTASIKWKLPVSYLVQSVSVTGEVLGACGVGKQIDPVKPVNAKSTSASIKFPSQITNRGDIQEVDINIGILGVNGATSRLVYAYGQCS